MRKNTLTVFEIPGVPVFDWELLPVYVRLLYVACVYALLRTIFAICARAKLLDTGLASAIIWGIIEAYRFAILHAITFALIQRASGKKSLRYAFIIAGLLGAALCIVVVFAVYENNFIGFVTFYVINFFLYIGVLVFVYKYKRKRWNVYYYYVWWIFLIGIFFLLGGILWTAADDTFCIFEIAVLLAEIGSPFMICWVLVDDSRYWREMREKFISTSKNHRSVNLLDGSVAYLSSDDYTELVELLSMQINVIDLRSLVLEEDPQAFGGNASIMFGTYGGVEIALKKLEMEFNADNIMSYLKEAFLSNDLHHKNVVKFFGVTLRPPDLFLVYESCNEGSLLQWIMKNEDMPFEMKVDLALQGARGLRFLHGLCYIHRDVNTNNLLVHRRGDYVTVKICDFGTCRKLEYAAEFEYSSLDTLSQSLSVKKDSDSFLRRKNKVSVDMTLPPSETHNLNLTVGVGTISYMAPELLKHMDIREICLSPDILSERASYDYQIDVYSYGAVMWEIYHCRRVFNDIKTVHELKKTVMRGGRPGMDTLCPPGYASLVEECMHQKPRYRPTFVDIVLRLENMILNSRKSTAVSSPPERGAILPDPPKRIIFETA